ncbi:response regulator [Thalassobaculum sp.]|uniref:response regulator n=1 Tax=Thalassobaculum sp. TaxID=2022740 RepID=UPI0032F09138
MSTATEAIGRGSDRSVPPAVLLVDDEPANLMAISEVLSGLGAEIVFARSGREALRQILLLDFCTILMDVRMPDMDGYETAAIIRQREKSRHIPLIFLTAYDKDEAQVFRGYSEGAVDYVFKPVEPVILRAKVSVFIDLYRQAEEIRRKAELEKRLYEENLRIRGEHMAAERRLRVTEKREAMVIRSLPIAVYEAEVDNGQATRTFLHDESTARLLGYSALDFATEPALWSERVHSDDWADASKILTELQAGDSYSVEYRWRRADDEYRYFLDQGVVVSSGDSDNPRVFGTMFDVHDRRMLEQQLMHSQKIETIGKLTGGIAHDFNNMLTVVIGNLDGMQRTKGLDPKTARRVDQALQGALHCRDLTQRLLGFARRESFTPRTIDLNALIGSLSDLVARTLGDRVEIRKKLAANLWSVHSDPGQIESSLLNLLVNSRDAMHDGGRVTIRTANARIDEASSNNRPDLPNGDYVILEVSDTGSGMTPEVLARACEAFYTTKETGRGTGLGLSTIHGFVTQSGGDLAIESELGKGTTVCIYLPRDRGAKLQPAVQPASLARKVELPRARDSDLVLVVEDERSVRQNAVAMLRELGYRIIEADSADAALAALEQERGVRLLFTDIVMPGSSNGYQLAREAKQRRPDLRILFTSGYDGDIVEKVSDDVAELFLRKPYRDYELAQAVHDAIG